MITSQVSMTAPALLSLSIVLVPLLLYWLYDSLKPRPLAGIPIGFPGSWANKHPSSRDVESEQETERRLLTRLPWFLGLLRDFEEFRKHNGVTAYFDDIIMSTPSPICQVLLGPANTWLSRLTGFGSCILICSDAQLIDELNMAPKTYERDNVTRHAFKTALPLAQISLSTDEQFKHHRKVLGPCMTPTFLSRSVERLVECVDDLIGLWEKRMEIAKQLDEATTEVKADITLVTMDMISSFVYGEPYGCTTHAASYLSSLSKPTSSSDAGRPPQVSATLHEILERVAQIAMAGPAAKALNFYFLHISKSFTRARAYQHQHAIAHITAERLRQLSLRDRAQQKGYSPGFDADHVLAMVVETEADRISKGLQCLSDAEIVDELISFLAGGAETVAAAVSWGIKFLAKNARVQHKLRLELRGNMENPFRPTYQELNDDRRCAYLQAVTYETLRLGRVAGATMRTTTRDTNLAGYNIPKNTTIFFPISYLASKSTIQRDKPKSDRLDREGRRVTEKNQSRQVWCDETDVEEFKPERWIQSDGSFDGSAAPFSVFGTGPRACFGVKLALLELKIILTKLVIRFAFDLPSDSKESNDMEGEEGLIRSPVRVAVKLRAAGEE